MRRTKPKHDTRRRDPIIRIVRAEIPFTAKVPPLAKLFLSKSVEFCDKFQKYFHCEEDKRTKIIVNSVLMKYLAPFLVELKENAKPLWLNYNLPEDIKKNYSKHIIILSDLIKRMKEPFDFLTQYEFTLSKESPYNKLIQSLTKWIKETRMRMVVDKKTKKSVRGALVLYGSENVDKRLLCSLLCKELNVEVVTF